MMKKQIQNIINKRVEKRRIAWFTLAVMALLFLQGCDPGLKPEEPCYFIQNTHLRRVSWGNSLPVKLHIHENVPHAFHEDIKEAVNLWNQSAGQVLFTIETWYVGGEAIPKRDTHSIIYWLEEWEEEKAIEQGRTTVYWRGDQIYEADIRINANNFEFFSGDLPESDKVHLKSLLIHELGHVLGLDHNEEEGSVMNFTLANGVFRDEIGEPDEVSLSCEYH